MGDYIGDYYRAYKGDTRSLDYGSNGVVLSIFFSAEFGREHGFRMIVCFLLTSNTASV